MKEWKNIRQFVPDNPTTLGVPDMVMGQWKLVPLPPFPLNGFLELDNAFNLNSVYFTVTPGDGLWQGKNIVKQQFPLKEFGFNLGDNFGNWLKSWFTFSHFPVSFGLRSREFPCIRQFLPDSPATMGCQDWWLRCRACWLSASPFFFLFLIKGLHQTWIMS